VNNKQQQYKNYWVLTDIMQIKEITSLKYSEKTGISHFTVKKYCRDGLLTCRRIDVGGNEITDWQENPRTGSWYVDTSGPCRLIQKF
jgi:hypothetical protein